MIINRVKKITDFRFLNLFSAQYTDRNQTEKEWIFASRTDKDNPFEKTLSIPDAVVIVPFHTDLNQLVLIKEFRVALNGYQIGFPAGLVDKGEGIEAACRRELYEETGLSVSQVLKTSPPIYSSSGLSDESICLVFVECQGQPTNQFNEASEDIEVICLGPQAANGLLKDPTLKFDVKTWIVLQQFAEQGRV